MRSPLTLSVSSIHHKECRRISQLEGGHTILFMSIETTGVGWWERVDLMHFVFPMYPQYLPYSYDSA